MQIAEPYCLLAIGRWFAAAFSTRLNVHPWPYMDEPNQEL